MPEMGLGPALNYIGVVPLCMLLFWAFMREWIVPGKRLRRVEKECDEWRKIAIDTMRASGSAIIPAAEAVHALVTSLPDPAVEHAAAAAETQGAEWP